MAELIPRVSLPIDELQRHLDVIEGVAAGIRDKNVQIIIFNEIEALDDMISEAMEEKQ